MVRLALFVGTFFFAVLAVEAWIEDPSHFYLPQNCSSYSRCGITLTKWVSQICTTIDDACVGNDGLVAMCCTAKCSCDDVISKCCPDATVPPLAHLG